MNDREEASIKMVPIEKIKVLNPRVRNKQKFQQIVSNIYNLGLKRPITVSQYRNKSGEESFDLVCGQGRLEAFIALGQNEIPAVVINVRTGPTPAFLTNVLYSLVAFKDIFSTTKNFT